MASCFERSMETSLIMKHNEMMRRLEEEYTNRICQLLKQKSMIMNSLQQQFMQQRSRINQTFSNPNNMIIHQKIHNYDNTKDQQQATFFTKIKQELDRMSGSNVNIPSPASIPNIYASISVKNEPVIPEMMPPPIEPHQELGQPIRPQHSFKKGDCVCAKYRDYPLWPGQIELNSHAQTSQNSNKISVKWFGDFSEASNECKVESVIPWSLEQKDRILVEVKEEDLDAFNDAVNNCNNVHLQKNECASNYDSKAKPIDKKKKYKNKIGKYKRSKVYNCPHCEYTTNVTTNLRNHIRTHTGERPYVCTFKDCGKRFAAKGNLNDHIKRHLGDKQHKCTLCQKAFVNKYELKVHRRKYPECQLMNSKGNSKQA